MKDSRLGLVMIHGFMSGPKAWEPLRRLIVAERSLGFVQPLAFEYATGLLPLSPLRVFPSIDTVADSLREYLATEAGAFDQLLLLTHSQGGLVAQRYLARMLQDGRGGELARIQRLVMLACPTNGSELLLSLRRRALGARHPQEKDLRPLNDQVSATLRTVVRDVVHATAVTDRTCPIPVSVYAGESDGVVSRVSAQSVFPDSSALPGDHSSILRADSPQHRTFTTLRRLALATRSEPYVPEPVPAEHFVLTPNPASASGTPTGEHSGKRRRVITVGVPLAVVVVASVLYLAPTPWKPSDDAPTVAPEPSAGATGSIAPGPPRTDSEGSEDKGVIPPEKFPSSNTFWLVDINKDKKAEYLTVDKAQNFAFWWNGGVQKQRLRSDGKGQNSYVPAPGADGAALRFGDIDEDGRPDCMVVSPTGGVAVHTWGAESPSDSAMCAKRYDGAANVPLMSTADRVPSLKEIQFADIDGDGRVDYLWIEPSSRTTVWFNRSEIEGGRWHLRWSSPTRISGTEFNREFRYADLTGDGRADPILITPLGGARGWINLGGAESGVPTRDICKIVPDTQAPPTEIQFADVDGDSKAEFLHIDGTGAVHVRKPDLATGCPGR
ncbi:FG-GAP-like repeat-containing protein [Streptomyces sp. NPDC057702]|uniref:FG-GAP-like repeat-containing protein n=1 Tax=unclassified Streptomyces TaxID=2593676 RepID=UPI00369E5958